MRERAHWSSSLPPFWRGFARGVVLAYRTAACCAVAAVVAMSIIRPADEWLWLPRWVDAVASLLLAALFAELLWRQR